MQGTIKLSFESGAKILQINPDSDVFWVDGLDKFFRSKASPALIGLIVRKHPHAVTIKDLFAHINKQFSLGNIDRPNETIHKYISQLEAELKTAGVHAKLFKNQRQAGYRLAPGWEIGDTSGKQSTVLPDLTNLHALVKRCIQHVEERPISQNKAGLMFLEAEQSFVHENFIRIDRFGWKLIHSLSEADRIPDVCQIKRDIQLLMSYVLFWRIGDGITEDKWRADYKSEINAIFEDIEIRVRKLLSR